MVRRVVRERGEGAAGRRMPADYSTTRMGRRPPNGRLQQRASEAKRVCCKPGLCSGPRPSERETTLVEDSRGAWVGPTGESPAAARADAGAFVEGTIAEGSTRTESV